MTWKTNIYIYFSFLFSRKAHLILRRVDRISLLCRSLLRSGYIQSRTESMPYVMCRSEDMRLASGTWHSSLHETRLTCVEKILSVQRNIYGKSKLRWNVLLAVQTCPCLIWSDLFSKPKWKETFQPDHQTKGFIYLFIYFLLFYFLLCIPPPPDLFFSMEAEEIKVAWKQRDLYFLLFSKVRSGPRFMVLWILHTRGTINRAPFTRLYNTEQNKENRNVEARIVSNAMQCFETYNLQQLMGLWCLYSPFRHPFVLLI